ncbi:MAG: GtrA family protein [Henriciella sp.]|nr:GtrA family protein [Henriciella sp.]
MVEKYKAFAIRLSRFGLVGGLAFVVDVCLTVTLMENGLDPFSARLIAIPIAMLVGWRLNRALTFGASGTSQSREGARYALVSVAAAGVNYTVYTLLMLALPGLWAIIAIAAATMVSMLVSFTGYQYFAFRKV